jgi:hypothetical protein
MCSFECSKVVGEEELLEVTHSKTHFPKHHLMQTVSNTTRTTTTTTSATATTTTAATATAATVATVTATLIIAERFFLILTFLLLLLHCECLSERL